MHKWSYKCWFWLIGGLLILLYGAAIWRNQFAMINGRPAFWLHDDMMISMRYARHLAQGQGLVWNVGETAVEGYSNFGWILVMTAVHRLPLPTTLTSLPILLLNMTLALWVLWLTARLMHTLVSEATLAIPAALLTLTLSADLFRWTTIGLETVLLTAVFLFLTLRLLQERQQPHPRTFLLIGLLGLIRADGLIYGTTLCLLAWLLTDNKRRVWQLAPLILIFPSAHLLFRLIYYGDFFPNTYHLKLTGWADRWQAGVMYIGRFMGQYGWVWAITGSVGLQRARGGQVDRFRLGHLRYLRPRHKALRPFWLMGLPLLAYAAYTGGDDFSGLRFLAPWLPILLALLFLRPEALRWRERPLPDHIHLPLLALFALLIILRSGYVFFRTPPADEQLFLKAGLTLRQQTPPETRIGVFWAGTLPYFAERPSTDMLGKNDATLARQPVFPGSDKPGHNKFNYDYSLGQLRPDLLVAPVHPAAIASAENLAFYSSGADAYVGQLYQNAIFQTEYAANLIFVGEVPIFIRRDSDLVAVLMNGRCQPFTNNTLLQLGLVKACWPFE